MDDAGDRDREHRRRVGVTCDDGIQNGIRVRVSSFLRPHVNSTLTKAKVCGGYVNSCPVVLYRGDVYACNERTR
mgnify:CR=1 FL=1